ncbi:hypothetical protein BT96DRAFT_941209 [Gymnopus androsaceus JB14]|uniref:Transmembrane protein n=1 Tax=Gymnopus androsaceus JB14 TaxID=1447944 RepID=A0A6A4HHM7_9AGAR|nr:hypothetical protein BT96DRAFT_941209 [Gymnopus androsaceus JB14]
MTLEESEQIALVGSVAFQNIANLMLSSGLFGGGDGNLFNRSLPGVYILAFFISMHIILQKENNGWAHRALIALLLAGFMMIALTTCASIAANLFFVKFGLVVSLPGGADTWKVVVMNLLEDWFGNFLLLFGELWHCIDIADSVADTKAVINLSNNTVTLDWLIGHGRIINQTVQYCRTGKHKWKQYFYSWLSLVQFLVWCSAYIVTNQVLIDRLVSACFGLFNPNKQSTWQAGQAGQSILGSYVQNTTDKGN